MTLHEGGEQPFAPHNSSALHVCEPQVQGYRLLVVQPSRALQIGGKQESPLQSSPSEHSKLPQLHGYFALFVKPSVPLQTTVQPWFQQVCPCEQVWFPQVQWVSVLAPSWQVGGKQPLLALHSGSVVALHVSPMLLQVQG